MTFRISAVTACCVSASSRSPFDRATVSLTEVAEPRWSEITLRLARRLVFVVLSLGLSCRLIAALSSPEQTWYRLKWAYRKG